MHVISETMPTPAVHGITATEDSSTAPLHGWLRDAGEALERTMLLVSAPPRSSFQGRTPLQTAEGMLAGIAGRLSSARHEVGMLPDGPERHALEAHVDHAISGTLEATELVRELMASGVTAPPPSALGAVVAQLGDTLAHVRAAMAVAVGEP